MIETLIAKMICDTAKGGGGAYFYEHHFEWRPRSAALQYLSISFKYSDVQDMELTPTHKKQVKVLLKDGSAHIFMMYRYENFIGFMKNGMLGTKNNPQPQPIIEAELNQEGSGDEMLDKLERLAKLHNSGALSDEEFAAAKKQLLGL